MQATGGTMAFTFTTPVLFSEIGLMDIPNTNLQSLVFTYQDGMVETFAYKGLGDNSVQRVIANKMNAEAGCVCPLFGSGRDVELLP
jgi:hypothetical protein